jgi:hypothetical protein
VNGTFAYHKTRLVAHGFSQHYDIDHEMVFSPIMKITSLCLLIALAATYDFEIHQMDVKTTIFNGIFTKEIYMIQPLGYDKSGEEHKMCHLLQTPYGLKQVPCKWYERFTTYLFQASFIKGKVDQNIYIIFFFCGL